MVDFKVVDLNLIWFDNFMGMCMFKVVFNVVINSLCMMFEI